MAEDASRKRLGRGLAALIGDIDAPASPSAASPRERRIPVELISRNPENPRREFRDAELDELAASLREHGVLQPVLVRPHPTKPGEYQLVAGERRWRAAQKAGLTELPVVLRELDDRTALEIAIIENIQRADLNAVEEAMGYAQLIEMHGYSQADLGTVIGKSRSHVANTLRLLKLPDAVQDMIRAGDLSAGHARTVVTAPDPLSLARRIVAEGLSVRDAERLAQTAPGTRGAERHRSPEPKDADTRALEKLLTDATGLSVSISHGPQGGEMRIRYATLEQLDQICRLLQGA